MPVYKVGKRWTFQACEVDNCVRRRGAAAADEAAVR